MFPEIDGGVKGESKDKTHAKQIDVLSWSWGMSNNCSAHVGGDAGLARCFWEDRAPRWALALGLVVLVGLGSYAWHRANRRPFPATEARFRLTAAPGASSSAPSAAGSVTPEWDTESPLAISDAQPVPEETPVETTLSSEGGTDVTPVAAGREADGGTVTAEVVQEGGREQLQRGAGAGHAQDYPSGAFTATTLGARARWRHVDRPRPPARPSFWQWLFGHKETKKPRY
jgi:hypothetical protein